MSEQSWTLRYSFTAPLPDDLSTHIYGLTQIPHIRCFASGKLVIVVLSSAAYFDEHSSPEVTIKLKDAGLQLVESPEARASRTIMAFRPPQVLMNKTLPDLTDEISTRNDVTVELLTAPKAKTPP